MVTASLMSVTASCKSLLVANPLSLRRCEASHRSLVMAMSCMAHSLPMFQVVPCLNSPKDSRAAASAEMLVLLPLVIPLLFSTAKWLPGSGAGVGESNGLGMIWLGTRVPGPTSCRLAGTLEATGMFYACMSVDVSVGM